MSATDMYTYLLQFYTTKQLATHANTEEKLQNLYSQCLPKTLAIKDLINYNGKLLVNSPDGFVPVKSLIVKKNAEILETTFESGNIIQTSPYHLFQMHNNSFVATTNLRKGSEVLTSAGLDKVVSVVDTTKVENVYDLAVDHNNHRYYTNGVVSHNSGSGKSLFLQNLALNWAELGLNVVYITLELSERLTALRLDAMATGYETKDIMKNIEDVALRVKTLGKKHKGTLRLKQLPNGSTANNIRAYIKEYEIQSGLKVDACLVDYLDLCMPMSKTVDPSNTFIKDKYISEELRNLAVELNILLTTASQLNRGSYDEIEFDASSISGGISKVNTADNVIGIFTTMAMRESGRYQLQFMKTRSSSGVGTKCDLAFDMKTLRISDLDEADDSAVMAQTKNVMDTLKKKNIINTTKHDVSSKPSIDTNPSTNVLEKGAALRSLLKRKD